MPYKRLPKAEKLWEILKSKQGTDLRVVVVVHHTIAESSLGEASTTSSSRWPKKLCGCVLLMLCVWLGMFTIVSIWCTVSVYNFFLSFSLTATMIQFLNTLQVQGFGENGALWQQVGAWSVSAISRQVPVEVIVQNALGKAAAWMIGGPMAALGV